MCTHHLPLLLVRWARLTYKALYSQVGYGAAEPYPDILHLSDEYTIVSFQLFALLAATLYAVVMADA